MGSNETTATAGAAGAAAGSIVAWMLSAFTGVAIDVPTAGLFATVGSFTFGRIFPR
jgi:hypothetical protein